MVVTAQTCRILLCDLKEAKMNVQRSLIQEIMFQKFELCHKAIEETKAFVMQNIKLKLKVTTVQ